MRRRTPTALLTRPIRTTVALVGALALLLVLFTPPAEAATLPQGFSDETVWSGLTNPVSLEFARDGKVFVGEKGGEIKVFDSVSDTTPTTFGTGLAPAVHDFWDRGLLGLAVDPQFPTRPYVYVLYTYDHVLGSSDPPPRWGDGCPNPPGATEQGCVVSGRLSRLTADPTGTRMVAGSERVIVEDWCQQFPSHSIGDLAFGPDGALYVSAGDGASFNYVDHGQTGNPCGDPMGGAGTGDDQGGALRAQDLRTAGDPVTLDGTVVRIAASTLANLPGGTPALTDNASRIVATGMRNPFRITTRPGTSEVWLGDVGWDTWEEINRIRPGGAVENFGWPCYEGNGQQPGYRDANLAICNNLAASRVTQPVYTWRHGGPLAGNGCVNTGSAAAGVAFYDPAGNYPASYDNALFFADYTRGCVGVMPAGTGGLPDPAKAQVFATGTFGVVDLKIGPDKNLWWVDLNGNVHRVTYTSGNQQPVARIGATPTSGPVPLTVSFDGRGSSDPDPGDTIASYSWDLNGDGTFGDATSATPTYTYTTPGTYDAKLKVTDSRGLVSDPTSVTIAAGNSPPTAVIDAPAPTLTWRAGDTISFSGHASDPQDGALPAAKLNWSLILHHCATPTDCHTHPVQDWTGVASGSFSAPDHDYPSWIELQLTATDSGGLTDTASVRLDPQTVALTYRSDPTGLQLTVGSSASTTEFTRTVIVGSRNTIAAPLTQTLNGTSYEFVSWSDGGAAQHDVTAPATPTTYTATYRQAPAGCTPSQWKASYFANQTLSGTPAGERCEATIDYDWGLSGPAGVGVGSDNFSARWVRTQAFAAGSYTFTATADDGIRVYLDGALVIDQWKDQSATTYTASRPVTAGDHEVKVEYYENGGDAVAKAGVTADAASSCPTGQYKASYFADQTLTGTPATERCEGAVNNDWGGGSPPGAGVGPDNFSVRWVGTRSFATTGTYTFTATADDGIRVYLDGMLLIDQWKDQSATTYTASLQVSAGDHEVTVEYYENGGDAVAKLAISP
ncbi:MAG TPA: PA14 domain-containing protein [Actinomycetota bacterium]|jgi:glucose/arabinose dehydrogenase